MKPEDLSASQQLDLGRFVQSLKAAKSEQPAAVVTHLQALIVPEGRGEAVKAEIAALPAGSFPAVLAIKTEEGMDILLLSEQLDAEAVTYAVGDSGMMVANVKKWVSTYAESSDFNENIAKTGLWNDIWTGLSTADTTLSNALDEASTPAEATAAVKSIMDGLSAYLQTVVSALPTTAYKAEKLLSNLDKAIKAEIAAKAEQEVPAVIDQVVDPAVADVAVVDPVVVPEAAPAPATFDPAVLLAQLGDMMDTKLQGMATKMEERFAALESSVVVEVTDPVADGTTLATKADQLAVELAQRMVVVGNTAGELDPPATVTKSEPEVDSEPCGWERA